MSDDDDDVEAAVFRRMEALVAFGRAMLKATERLAAAGTDPGAQRQACYEAIAGVLAMMDACEVSLRLGGPLHLLAAELDAVDRGSTPPLFTPPARPSKRPVFSRYTWVQRAIPAAALELRMRELLEHGQTKAEAVRWVLARTKGWAIWGSKPQANRAGQLSRWRDELARRPRADLGRIAFERYTDPALGWTAEQVIREASVFGVPGAPAPTI